jgi:hypothetical protein
MFYTPEQVEALAPNPEAFKAGNKLASESQWQELGNSDRAIWGKIKGSGSQPYFTQIDHQNFASKCSCPSRQFPCKHGVALLLIYARKADSAVTSEPDWVNDWVGKRKAKEEVKEQKELTPEEIAKREQSKEKREEDRITLVNAGVAELSLWLSDLMKRGLLDLPNIPYDQFINLSARMVDAKAPGLGTWIKALANVNYTSMDTWYPEALEILAKLNLIIKSWNNFEKLSPEWQTSIKNMMGWSQAPKELLANKDAQVIKDDWIILGQEREQLDDIVLVRTWLRGIATNTSSLDLSFSFNGSSTEIPLVPGTIINAELAFFDGHFKQRSVLKSLTETKDIMPERPILLSNLHELGSIVRQQKSQNPWLNNESYLLKNMDVIYFQEKAYLMDETQYLFEIHSYFDEQKMKQWILNTGNHRSDIAIAIKNEKALILGVLANNKYHVL